MNGTLKILMVASEVAPYAQTGGLADVMGALPQALRRAGHDVRVILPKYRVVDDARFGLQTIVDTLPVPLGDGTLEGALLATGDRSAFFVANGSLYDRDALYGDASGDYGDNARRFAFFARAVLETCKRIGLQPDVIHCHDWQAGLVPVFLKIVYAGDEFFRNTATVFTIHNLGYQGNFGPEAVGAAGLPYDRVYHIDGMEYYGGVSYLKGGVNFADAVSTVSERYALEIQTPEYGRGMDGVLAARRDALFGIPNGVDTRVWDPGTDPLVAANFTADDLAGKARCKAALIEEVGLPKDLATAPLLGVVSRLTEQKGIDLVAQIVPRLAKKKLGLVVLGEGDEELETRLAGLAAGFPKRLAFRRGWDEALAHRIYAASDLFLVPSRYEPCGLSQMYAMRYGAIPIVRATGGLDDTVREWNAKEGSGTGFKFVDPSEEALLLAIENALKVFRSAKQLAVLRRNGMTQDFSWDRSAQRYATLYQTALHRLP